MKFRDSEVMSRCWQNYLDHPELFIPIEYVLHFPSAPVEMRGALLSVALESLSKVVLRKHEIKDAPPVVQDKWETLRGKFLDVLKSEIPNSDTGYSILENKIKNLNQSTNREKLSRPFELYDISLTSEEIAAIDKRNKLLHQGVLLSLDSREAQGKWKEAYMIEMRLYTLINRLILSLLDYEGPIINWGDSDLSGDSQKFYYRSRSRK